MSNHVQCILTRWRMGTEGPVKENSTSWIPEDIAILGRRVKLKEADGTWETWDVKEVGAVMDSKRVSERGQDYKRTRKASDI